MPTYCYECAECEESFEAFHSVKYKLEECAICGAENSLSRIPSMPYYIKKNDTGKVVKDHIEEAKRELQKDKQEASQREYK
jgi:putative FmdB family regulatory protein